LLHNDLVARRNIKVTWYDDPAEAERDLHREHEGMSPTERVAEVVRLMILCAGWSEHGRLERTARVVEVP
jgi:hypothetical protein